MNGHLSGEQISACVLDMDEEAAHHLRDCSACRTQAEELRETLAGFRTAVHSAAEREEWFWTRQRAYIRERALTEGHGRRWAWTPLTTLALLLLAVIMLTRAPHTPQAINTDVADNQLLNEVDNDVQREFPSALAPAILINDERNDILTMQTAEPAELVQREHQRNE